MAKMMMMIRVLEYRLCTTALPSQALQSARKMLLRRNSLVARDSNRRTTAREYPNLNSQIHVVTLLKILEIIFFATWVIRRYIRLSVSSLNPAIKRLLCNIWINKKILLLILRVCESCGLMMMMMNHTYVAFTGIYVFWVVISCAANVLQKYSVRTN